MPFSQVKKSHLTKMIIETETHFEETIWKNFSIEAKEFTCKLLRKNPNERISADQALLESWFEELS